MNYIESTNNNFLSSHFDFAMKLCLYVFFNVVLIVTFLLFEHLVNQRKPKVSTPSRSGFRNTTPPPIEVPALSLDELKDKTENFGSNSLIGEGSYGRVYYATMEDGKAMAIKKLDVSSEPEPNSEFLTQVGLKVTFKPRFLLEIT